MFNEEPTMKRVYTFFDLQNLYLSAKTAWGVKYPDFDPIMLSKLVTGKHLDWRLTGIKLYTGIHSIEKNVFWHNFWVKKLSFHRNMDSRVDVFTAQLHYNNNAASEKGVDIRLALDLVRAARKNLCDVAVLFSRDTDFGEVAQEIRAIADENNRWIKIASAFPSDPMFKRGINGTDWITISRAEYDACLDPNDYRG